MTYAEVKDALDGLSAYDLGCSDSGIRDELLRERVKTYLRALSDPDRRKLLGRIMRELFLTDEALAQGYGPEDAKEFGVWLDDEMNVLV